MMRVAASSSNPSDDASRTLFFQTIERQYDAILTRRNTLNTQASSLMSFGGIINTVLVGFLIALATNPNGKSLLMSNPYFNEISVCIGIGFVAYILASALSLWAFREAPWIPAPQIVYERSPGVDEKTWSDKLKKEFDDYQAHPSKIPVVQYELQLSVAMLSHQKTNDRKYYLVQSAFLLLVVGILFTALSGLLVLIGSF